MWNGKFVERLYFYLGYSQQQIMQCSGGPIGGGSVIQCTEPFTLKVTLTITFTTKFPVMLGFPWMQAHNYQISWKEHEIMTSPHSLSQCGLYIQ